MSRIYETIHNECPDCKESPHDTQTLFNYNKQPDNFNYHKPLDAREAALYLGSDVEELTEEEELT